MILLGLGIGIAEAGAAILALFDLVRVWAERLVGELGASLVGVGGAWLFVDFSTRENIIGSICCCG